jgi:hypothetical protein
LPVATIDVGRVLLGGESEAGGRRAW